jgi:hypothetical protein
VVIAEINSRKFNWQPEVIEGDDTRVFIRNYVMTEEAVPSNDSFRSKFADLPSAGIWEKREKSDDELLEELGSGWRGFATEQ